MTTGYPLASGSRAPDTPACRSWLKHLGALVGGPALAPGARRGATQAQGSDTFLGEILLYAYQYVPKDFAMCNGQLLPVNQNQALLALLRVADGSSSPTSFALPDQPQSEAAARSWPRAGLPDLCMHWHELSEALARLVRAAKRWHRGALATPRRPPLRVLNATPWLETVAAPPDTLLLAAPGQPLRLPDTPPHPAANTGPMPSGTVLQPDAAAGVGVACEQGKAVRLDLVALEKGYFTGLQPLGLAIEPGEVLGQFLLATQPQSATPARVPT